MSYSEKNWKKEEKNLISLWHWLGRFLSRFLYIFDESAEKKTAEKR
jgi:hypothetical protein